MIRPCTTQERDLVVAYFEYRFEMDLSFMDDFELYAGPRGRIALGPKVPLEIKTVDIAGIVIARLQRTVKPSTNFIQCYGHLIKTNIVRLERDRVPLYCKGANMMLSDDEKGDGTDGFVMVAYDDMPLGCGLLRDNRLKNQLPKEIRMDLRMF